MNARTGVFTVLIGAMAAGCSGTRTSEAQVTGAPPPPAMAVVTGTVAYRERMALPPDATVDLWMVDTSPGIITMAILGETTVRAEGRQVPLPFELRVDASRVEATHTYGLRAAIRAGGEVLFANDQPVAVLTQGHPSKVAVILTRAGGSTRLSRQEP